jgi:thioredoxin-like negative regulator of GroEL
MADQGEWLPAAWALVQAVRNHPSPVPKDLLERMHEAVYKAYQYPEALQLIPLDMIETADPAMAEVVHARSELLAGAPLKAEVIIAEALKLQAGFPEANLLQAQILIDTRAADRGRAILEELVKTENVPLWIREEAKQILEKRKP